MGAVNLLDRPLDDLIKPHGGGELELDRDNPITRGLVGAWLINEGGGAKYYDLTGNNDGTYALTTGTHTGRAKQGKYGEAFVGLAVGGSDGRVNLGSIASGNPFSLSDGNACTIAFLAEHSDQGINNDFPRLVEKATGASGANGWSIQAGENGGRTGYFYAGGASRSDVANYFLANEPAFYAITRDAGDFAWYRDGSLIETDSTGYTTNFSSTTANAAIGNATFIADREWVRPIWLVYVWDRALLPHEVRSISDRPYQIVRDPLAGRVLAFKAPAGATVTFAGTLAAVSALTGAIGAKRAMSGAAASTTTLAGTLAADRSMAGTLASTSALVGDVAIARSIAGTLASVSSLAGDAAVVRGMAGTVASVSALSGGVDVARSLTGSLDAISGLAGDVAVDRALSGTLAAVSAMTGALTISGQVLISGALAASSGLAGVLEVARPIAGIVTSVSGLAGDVGVTRGLVGALAANSGLAGALTVTPGAVTLAGSLAAVSGLQGNLSRLAGLDGELAAISALAGALSIQGQVDPVTYQDTANAYANTRTIGAAGNTRVIGVEPTIEDS